MDEVPIKVAVRVRPLVGQEKVHSVNTCVYCLPSKPQLILGKDRGFTFDFVFNPETPQSDVYEACVEPLVKSCLQGYNATVFAYGQTGSGKTHTMGSLGTGGLTDNDHGIIPRAVKQIFQMIEEKKDKVEFEIHVSYIEIYLEELRDLLELETSSKEIHIRENEKGNTVVMGATEQLVETIDDVMSCLDTGSAARQTGTTNMNEESSRSHAIFTLYIVQKPIGQWEDDNVISPNKDKAADEESDVDYSEYKYAKFHFVDLAGSERVDRTGNVGERFKESIQINTGLLALGNVISSLADSRKKVVHIPYRDSKVTRLLKDSLGGNARTVMVTCLSPAEPDFAENLNSLKYATRARNIHNKPVINRDPQNTRLMAMQNQIMALREELERRRSSGVPPTDLLPSKEQKDTEQLQRYRDLCEGYIKSTISASSLLRSVYTTGHMNKQQRDQYEQWMRDLDELTSTKTSRQDVGYVKMIDKLKRENIKYKSDLSNDEEVFTRQSCQIDILQRQVTELEVQNSSLQKQISDMVSSLKKKDDQLFEQQLQLNQTTGTIKNQQGLLPRRGRANTAPTDEVGHSVTASGRQVYTSPSILPSDRMIQGFRARSQLLMKKYEERDEVECNLSESSDSEDEQDDISRDLGRTWKVRGTLITPKSQIIVDNASNDVLDELRSSTQVMSKEVHQTEVRLEDAHHKLRDLTINIRQKEKLIKELVKSEEEERKMKEHFSKKVDNMKHEVDKAKRDVDEAKKALEQIECKANIEMSEKQKAEQDYKKNLQLMESKIQALQRKQKDSEKLKTFHEEKAKKVKEFEGHIERMKSQQESLGKRLKEESDKKSRLEREMSKQLQRIKELEEQSEQQQKIIRRKTEQVANAQRRLRGVSKQGSDDKQGDEDLKKKRQWLDVEVEKILQQKHDIETLQEDLKKREDIIKQKENMIAEKSTLEMKKLRSSQIINKDILRVSTQLMKVEQEIKQQEESKQNTDSLHGLVQTRDELNKQRVLLEDKLKAGELLDPIEEARLIELDEGIEALEVAIDYKTDNIENKEREIQTSDPNTLNKEIQGLDKDDAINLLHRYLDKVIQLRQSERKLQIESSDREVRINEQERIISELQRNLQQSVMVAERKITKLQQEHEEKVQFLMSQLGDIDTAVVKESEKDHRTQQLERDLYYYKKTCRDLKKRLREVTSIGIDSSTSVKQGEDEPVKAKRDGVKQSTSTSKSFHTSTKLSSTGKSILPSLTSSTRSSVSTLKQSKNPDGVDDLTQDSIEPAKNPWG